jgi:hypothetical protein
VLYLFAYELTRPLSEHPQLVQFIDGCSAKAHVMDNVWLLERSDLPSNFQDDLRAMLDPKDRFYLVDVSRSVIGWSGLEEEVADFIGRFSEAVEQDVSRRLLVVAFDGASDLELQPLVRNLWQVETERTSEQLAAQLREGLGEDGRLLVADVSLAPAAWLRAEADAVAAAVVYTRSEQGETQRQEF